MAKAPDGRELVQPSGVTAWRKWLAANHATSDPVWLVYRKTVDRKRDLSYDEAVEEALCWGWIDSTVNRHDETHYRQFFSRRKPTSTWSRSNKERVARLIAEDRMRPAGQALIDAAKANGMWTALDAIDDLEVPPDLAKALRATKGARKNFEGFSASSKKMILWWIASAKRPETRAKRITETARKAADGKRANYRQDRD
jgi:uncharacterized protein YdeI (YjbR/CyaY-like superfamily)